ncbi:hypothetical protein EC973_007880, partial [Apophysomyces ossiformis]
LARQYHIKTSQLRKWNPSINGSCTNLKVGQALCVGGPGKSSKDRRTRGSKTEKKPKETQGSSCVSKEQYLHYLNLPVWGPLPPRGEPCDPNMCFDNEQQVRVLQRDLNGAAWTKNLK